MKKITLFTILTIFCLTSFGQVGLGLTESELKLQLTKQDFILESDYDKDNQLYIIVTESDKATITYNFEKKICSNVGLFPNDEEALKYFVELYNKQFTIISSTKWKMYSEGYVVIVELSYIEDKYFFIFYFEH